MILLKKNSLIVLFSIVFLIFSFVFVRATANQNTSILKAPVTPKSKKYNRLKKAVAVINFKSTSPSIEADVGKGITDMLITELVKSGQFIVIEREKLDEILAEQLFSGNNIGSEKHSKIKKLENKKQMSVTGILTPRLAVQIGKILGADTIITGRVINFGLIHPQNKKDYFIVGLEAHLISSQTGKTLAVCEAISKSKSEVNLSAIKNINFESKAFVNSLIGEATRGAINQIISEIKDTMISYPWIGNIIKIVGDKIYISGGKDIGLKEKDELIILEEIKYTEDKATGAITEREFKKIDNITISQLDNKYSICILPTKRGYNKNYFVQLNEEYTEEQKKPEENIIILKKINEEEHWKKIESLWNELNEEIYNDTARDIVKVRSGSVYLLPHQKLTPKAQELIKELEKEHKILVKHTPDNPDIYNSWAWFYYNINEFNKSIKLMEKAIALKPKDPELRSQLGSIYITLLDKFKPTLHYNTDTIEGITMLSVIYSRNQDFSEQHSMENEIMQKHEITKGDIERWRWEYIRNEEMFLEMSGNRIDPEKRKKTIENILYFTNINVWKNHDRCVVVLSDITEQIKDNPLLWNSLGTACGIKSLVEKKKEYMDKAEECVKKAVELDPQNRWFHEQLAVIYSLKGGYYTGGPGVSTIYLLDSGTGLGYEPKFLYPNKVERNKYKELAIKEIAIYKDLTKKHHGF